MKLRYCKYVLKTNILLNRVIDIQIKVCAALNRHVGRLMDPM